MIRKLVLAAALATIGTAAVADTYTAATPLTNQVEQHTFSHGAGYFFDTFNFTIGTPGTLSASAVSINLANLLGITGLTGTLWDNHHPNGWNVLGTLSGNNVTANFSNLAAGNYHIDFEGNATGTWGGSYLAAVSVAAVPEPETYALLLAGLGLMGTVARRRSRNAV